MKKICFISFTNLYLCPYIDNYLKNLDYSCDIYVWDRHCLDEKKGIHNVYSFKKPIMDNGVGKISKLLAYLKYKKWLKKQIKRKKYDLIIFLQSIAAIFMSAYLFRTNIRYVIDIRDYSIEGNKILYLLEKKLLKRSVLNVISSPGYKEFLPSNIDYVLCHNYSLQLFNEPFVKHTSPIRLSYIGLIRFHEINKKIIDLFLNDNRFEISFIGKNALELQEYINKKRANNIILLDAFPPEDTFKYVRSTDCILNVYGNHNPLLDFALSNKLYLSAAFKKPIIVSSDTYMEKYSIGYGFGFALNFDDSNIKDKLFNFYSNLDNSFEKNCSKFIDDVIKENEKFNDVCKTLFD